MNRAARVTVANIRALILVLRTVGLDCKPGDLTMGDIRRSYRAWRREVGPWLN